MKIMIESQDVYDTLVFHSKFINYLKIYEEETFNGFGTNKYNEILVIEYLINYKKIFNC